MGPKIGDLPRRYRLGARWTRKELAERAMGMGETRVKFGDLLRRYRLAAGWSQEELAERAHLSPHAISDLERGVRNHPWRDTVQFLADALDLEPSKRAQLEGIARRVRPPSGEQLGRAPPGEGEVTRTNLPIQVTSFVGRERELAQVTGLLQTTRLLTLTGTGGCGKTRLALQVAADLIATYRDGVWLVELAPLADPELVADAVAAAVGVPEGPGQPVETDLLAALRTRRLLLVLDNCEHLISACARFANALLRGCPEVGILATSREALRTAGEVSWRVPSLGIPRADRELSRDVAVASEAVRLFVERAGAVRPGFQLTERNAPTIAQICARLDGLPLAIELAAARVAVMPVGQIAVRLDQRFRLLTGGSRAALPRQQTLAATVRWSHELLTAAERTLFHRLAVFAGSFTLEAAEVLCGDEGDEGGRSPTPQTPSPIPREDVLNLVSELVHKSLVVAAENEDGPARYALLETLREFARERLDESGEAERVQERHAAHYLALAADAELGPDSFDQLEREHNNLRAALRWFLARGDAERAQRLGAALWGFWAMRGYLTEGKQWLATLLTLPESAAPPEVRANLLEGAGRLAFNQSDFSAARPLIEQSLARWREAGDQRKVSQLLVSLGHLHREQGDFTRARALFGEGLTVARDTGSRHDMATALSHRGLLALQEGNFPAAQSFLEECLGIQRDLKDELGLTWTASRLGHVAHGQRDLVTARRLYSESLAMLRRWDDKRGMASMLTNLGMVDVDEGDDAGARAHLRESAELLAKLRDRAGTAMLLDACAGRAAARQQPARALHLAGAAASLREAIGARHARNLVDWLERALAPTRLSLGDEGARAMWAEGQAMTLEQAIAYTLEEDSA